MLAAASLVLLMTPALAFFYGGMTRSKTVLNMMMMCFGAIGIVSILWMLCGFSEAFGDELARHHRRPSRVCRGLRDLTDDGSLMARATRSRPRSSSASR